MILTETIGGPRQKTPNQVTPEIAEKLSAEELAKWGYYVSDEALESVSTDKLAAALGDVEDGPPEWSDGRWPDRCESALAKRFSEREPLRTHLAECKKCPYIKPRFIVLCGEGSDILRGIFEQEINPKI